MNDTNKLALIDQLQSGIPSFKCVEGCSDCCGPIITSRLEYKRMLSVSQRTAKEVHAQALASLRRHECDCPFIDKVKGGCSVHAVRPTICRLFGAVDDPTLTCPHGKRPDVLLTDEQSRTLLGKIGNIGH